MSTLTPSKTSWRERVSSQLTGGIYVHVPFCQKKCPYCHFAVRSYQEPAVNAYIRALKKEWAAREHLFDTISTLYFGGGTPSLLDEKAFEIVFHIFPKCLGEITIEANPENITYEKMKFYKQLGINRVSIGVQSLSEDRLVAIGREHTAKKALEGIENTLKAGIENISVDLMYDLPNQTFGEFKDSVDQVSLLDITHISLYNLVFEPGALYYKDRNAIKQLMPNGDVSTKMLSYAIDRFEDAGFGRYEISAFAKKGYEAVHNTSYWKGLPFIGLGPSAFSYHDGKRFRNSLHQGKWHTAIEAGKEPVDFEEELKYPDNVHELLAIRLRILEGIDVSKFDLPNETLNKIEQLINGGYLEKRGNLTALTKRGTLFYDTVASELI